MKHLEEWLLNQKKINKIKIKRKNLDRLENWIISHKKIYHITKKFFQIIGIRVTSNFNKKTWDQPIMVQNENGILGIIRKKFNNDYKYLLQAKPEPGNINYLQLSPTVQATESNYKQVHGGKKTKYLEYFINKKFLIKSKQSEQGLRYLNKFNTNYLVEIKKKLKLSNNFKWFSKSELLYLIKKKNLLNMDTLSVFSCSIKSEKNEKLINSNKELDNWIKKNDKKYKIYYKYFLGMQVFSPLNLVPFIKSDAESFLNSNYGWEPFLHKHHESRFTRFYEDFWLPRKFGFQKRKAHFSSLILTGQMTREEALERLSKPELSEDFLKKEFEYVAEKLDLTKQELLDIFDGENKTFRDYSSKIKLIMVGAKIMDKLGLEKRLFRKLK